MYLEENVCKEGNWVSWRFVKGFMIVYFGLNLDWEGNEN